MAAALTVLATRDTDHDADGYSPHLWYTHLESIRLPDHAALAGTNLHNARLSWSDWPKANLSCADLRYADLVLAELPQANLSGADLSSADWTKVNLKARIQKVQTCKRRSWTPRT
ncbi:pentapeptide repeat-containing protein [Streptomyces sp. NPDC006365]|uniref:pentapeptide repeat-containing protein n=1 Tax=Streptomyces sp. NPDC006365 TaxID=3364744 RepID=UPI0036920F0F